MDSQIKKEWVAALRSGKYKQGYNTLCNESEGTHCCLGVLCEISPFEYDKNALGLPLDVQAWAKLPLIQPIVKVECNDFKLAHLNDGGYGVPSRNFNQIADLIEAQL